MTIHIADIASYQGELALADLKAAGFSAINVKVSHILTRQSVHPLAATYVREARALGLGVGTFHWLAGGASGAEQARYAHARMLEICGGDLEGVAHTVDCEDTARPATESQWREYCATMASLLGRDIVTYTGDWWWTDHARGWGVSPFSPWVWAAPNAGYLPSYPGDDSPHWTAGYGMWPQLAVMQYRVGRVSGIDVSQSAIRETSAWAKMRGIGMAWINIPASTSLLAEINEVGSPNRNKAQDGTVGDLPHQQEPSDHNPDETGQVEDEWDVDSINEVHARDVDARGPWLPGWSMERIVQIVVARCRAGQEKRLRYVIFNRRIWSEASNWAQRTYSGGDPHDTHAHFSFHYGSGSAPGNPEQVTSAWGIRAAYEGEDEVSSADVVTGLTTKIPYTISRIKDRGWGDLSLVGRLDYMFESMVASGLIDVDGDGDLDVATIPARVARIEALLIAMAEAAGVPIPSFDPPAKK